VTEVFHIIAWCQPMTLSFVQGPPGLPGTKGPSALPGKEVKFLNKMVQIVF